MSDAKQNIIDITKKLSKPQLQYFKASELMKEFEGKEYFLSVFTKDNISEMPFNCVIFIDITTKNGKKLYVGRNKFYKYYIRDGKLDSICYEAFGKKKFINNIAECASFTLYAWHLEKKAPVEEPDTIEEMII